MKEKIKIKMPEDVNSSIQIFDKLQSVETQHSVKKSQKSMANSSVCEDENTIKPGHIKNRRSSDYTISERQSSMNDRFK